MRIILSILFLLAATCAYAASPEELYREILAYRVAETFNVRNASITRYEATIEFESGEIQMLSPVQDRYHGLLFTGKGTFRFKPPDPIERDQLHKFTSTRVLEEPFTSALLRFSDETAVELLKAKSNVSSSKAAHCGACREIRTKTLKKFLRNFDSRVLRDIYSGKSDYFMAYIYGKTKGEFLLELDPEQKEQFTVVQNSRMDMVDVWSSYLTTPESPADEVKIPYFEAEIEIEKDGKLTAKATMDLYPAEDLKSVALNLSPILELEKIEDSAGNSLFFIYETGEDRVGEPPLKQDRVDIFFPSPVESGRKTQLRFTYRSDHMIKREGSRNEYLIHDTIGWYPRYGYLNRSTSKVTYCYPEDLELFAVGKKIGESSKEKKKCSTWEQQTPVAVISFSIGQFKHKTITAPGLPVADIFSGKHHSGLRIGGSGLDNVAADVVNSLNFFQSLFGPYPFESILATEIPASHGQGFPGLLHLSRTTFEDNRLKGLDEAFRAHEVSHQWWGHVVGWESYRDQWISEGFAEFSGALYADAAHPGSDLMMKIVESWKDDVLNRGSVRIQRYGAGKMSGQFTMGTDAGPISLGLRLSSSKSPADYRILVYEKGAYVLHMLRMMMKDFQANSDERFFAMMREFVQTYSGKNATTEGFKAIAEKHQGADLQWFFDQWVYGTYVPQYAFAWRVEPSTDGKFVLITDVQQKSVPDGFQMPVPLYLDFGKERFAVHRILVDEEAETFRIPLPEKPRNVQFNYQRAVLARE